MASGLPPKKPRLCPACGFRNHTFSVFTLYVSLYITPILRDFFGKAAGYLCNSQICIYFAKFFKWVLCASAPDVKQAVAARVCESTINANSNANCKYCKRAEKRSEISP